MPPGIPFLPLIKKCCFSIPLHVGCVIIGILCVINGSLLCIVRYYWACTFSYVFWRSVYEVVMWGAGFAQLVGGLFLLLAVLWLKQPELVYTYVVIQLFWCIAVALYLLLYFLGLFEAGTRSPLDRPECTRTSDNLLEVLLIVIQLIFFAYFAEVAYSYQRVLTPES